MTQQGAEVIEVLRICGGLLPAIPQPFFLKFRRGHGGGGEPNAVPRIWSEDFISFCGVLARRVSGVLTI